MQPASDPTGGGHRHLGAFRQLTVPGLSAQLQAGLVQKPITVHPPRGQLSPVGVQWQFAVECDPGRPLDERPGFAVAAETQCLQRCEREKRETVVDFGHIDIGGCQIRPRPHLGRSLTGRHLREVVAMEPPARPVGASDRLDPDGGIRAVRRVIGM